MSEAMRLWDGDIDRIKRRLDTGDVADAVTEIMRSRGVLLEFVLRIANNKALPDAVRESARAALENSPIR